MVVTGANFSGIYVIRNLINGKVYVGQSVNIQLRLLKHMSELRGGNHSNSALQGDWNRFGPANFVTEVLEAVSPDLLDRQEAYWITRFNSLNNASGYNQTIN